MSDRMYHIIVGMCIGTLIWTTVMACYPIIDTDLVCHKCNSQQWWFIPSK